MEEVFEIIMMEKFPKLVTDIKPQFQEAEHQTGKMQKTNKQTHTKKPKKTISRNIILKLQKIKEKKKFWKRGQQRVERNTTHGGING